MTKRDFFILLIKVYGLYSIITSLFSIVPANIGFAYGNQPDIGFFIWMVIAYGLLFGFFWLLLTKADRIIDWLHLDKGFSEERIELGNLTSGDVVKIGIFVIGGLMVVDNLPWLLSQTYWAFKKGIAGLEYMSEDKINLGVAGLKVLAGYLLITNYDRVSRLLKTKKSEE